MKKILIAGFIAVVLTAAVVTVFFSLSSPKESRSDYSLHLVVDSWSDQDVDYPEKTFDFENIKLNKTYVIPLEGNSDYYLREFKVIKIEKNSITISTPIPLSNNGDGTINLNSRKKKFVIEHGMTLILDTLIMDAGEWYQFTLTE